MEQDFQFLSINSCGQFDEVKMLSVVSWQKPIVGLTIVYYSEAILRIRFNLRELHEFGP